MQSNARALERVQRSTVFTFRSVSLVFFLIEQSEGMLSFPLQKYMALGILFDFALDLFRQPRVMHTCGHMAFYQHGIQYVETVAVVGNEGNSFVGVVARLL